jgi:hypothetical protein
MTNIGNQHFSALQSRAQNLHANTAQLDKQQKDVIKATEGLKKETEKLRKWADEGQRMVKELGDVQNWAEMLERDFLVLSETIRLANGGGSHSGSGSGSSSEWETDESEFGDEGVERKEQGEGEQQKVVHEEPVVREEMRVVDAEGDTDMHGSDDKGKGKAVDIEQTTGTGHQSEDLGGSSTGTGSDPSSSSVHTAASGAS